MTLRLVGAGLGRTGTHSLKIAIERLLGAPCYHMAEVFGHPEHVPTWHAAMRGESADLNAVLDGYAATVDWPGAGVWPELVNLAPDAVVLLSTRSSAAAWYKSAQATIFEALGHPDFSPDDAWSAMANDMLERFTPRWRERDAAMAAYDAHNAAVRAEVPAAQLVEWQPGDGWEPLCAALGVPVPEEEFPHTNSTEEFRSRAGFDA